MAKPKSNKVADPLVDKVDTGTAAADMTTVAATISTGETLKDATPGAADLTVPAAPTSGETLVDPETPQLGAAAGDLSSISPAAVIAGGAMLLAKAIQDAGPVPMVPDEPTSLVFADDAAIPSTGDAENFVVQGAAPIADLTSLKSPIAKTISDILGENAIGNLKAPDDEVERRWFTVASPVLRDGEHHDIGAPIKVTEAEHKAFRASRSIEEDWDD